MSFYSESLPTRFAGFFSKNFKKFIVLALGILGGVGYISYNNIQQNKIIARVNDVFDVSFQMEDKKEYSDALKNLKTLEDTLEYKNLFEQNKNLQMTFLLYEYKLSQLARVDMSSIHQKILDLEYYSQGRNFRDYSEVGEFLLGLKTEILFSEQRYEECVEIVNKHKMQQNHFKAKYYKALSLLRLEKKEEAFVFLFQNIVGFQDYTQFQILKQIFISLLLSVK